MDGGVWASRVEPACRLAACRGILEYGDPSGWTMLGDDMSDTLWHSLEERMERETCPSCHSELDRGCVEIQPVDDHLWVRCSSCGEEFYDPPRDNQSPDRAD